MSNITIPHKQEKQDVLDENSKYLDMLPSNQELIDYVKFSLASCLADASGLLTTDKFGAEIDLELLKYVYKKPCTDVELIESVVRNIRMFLVPYEQKLPENRRDHPAYHFRFYYDHARFSYNKGSLYGVSWSEDYGIKYNFMDKDFIAWLRELFECPETVCISDEDALEETMIEALSSMLWFGKEKYNLSERIQKFKNYKEFKADLGKFLKENNIDTNGGGTSFLQDTYRYSYENSFNNPILIVDMDRTYREYLGRECDYALKQGFSRDEDRITVFYLKGDDYWKTAFDLFKYEEEIEEPITQGFRQTSLFDFL
jgi:hypothetical protein